MKKSIDKYGKWILYFIFAVAVFFIAYQTPYCHDEWKWGLDFRVELMKNGFKNYNGRYLGNLLALLITRSEMAKNLVITLGTVGVLGALVGCSGLSKEKKEQKDIFTLILAIFLIFAVPQPLFAQSYGWPAAFVNFVPAVVLFLIYYRWTEVSYFGEKVNCSIIKLAAVFLLGFATQMFSEHITIFVVMYALWMVVYTKIKSKVFCKIHIVYLVSVVSGALVMFSNGAYTNAATKPTGYKHIAFSFITMYEQFTTGILDNLFVNNWILNTSLSVVLIFLIALKKKKGLLYVEMILMFTGYSVYSIWHKLHSDWVFLANANMNTMVEIFLSFMFFINVLACMWLVLEKDQRLICCVLYFSMALSAAPLIAAKPIGPRCFYISYVLECLVILKLIRVILEKVQLDLYYLILVSGIISCTLLVVYMRMFAMIGASDRYREVLIQEAISMEAEEVILPVLPYAQFTWTTEPTNEEWEGYFKEFYGIPEKMDVVFR